MTEVIIREEDQQYRWGLAYVESQQIYQQAHQMYSCQALKYMADINEKMKKLAVLDSPTNVGPYHGLPPVLKLLDTLHTEKNQTCTQCYTYVRSFVKDYNKYIIELRLITQRQIELDLSVGYIPFFVALFKKLGKGLHAVCGKGGVQEINISSQSEQASVIVIESSEEAHLQQQSERMQEQQSSKSSSLSPQLPPK